MVEVEIPDKWISNILKAGGVMIVLIMVGTLIRPSITGNVTTRVATLDTELKGCFNVLNQTEIALYDTELVIDSLARDISNLTHQNHACIEELYYAQNNLSNATGEYELLNQEFRELRQLYINLTKVHEDTVDEFMGLSDSLAVDVCCDRSPDVEYGSYDIRNNFVTCRTEDNGDYELKCN